MSLNRLAAWAALVAGGAGCGVEADTAPAAEEAEEIDCEAGDLGDGVPHVIGLWTINFAQNFFDESCGLGSLNQDSETWLKNAAMEVRGLPPHDIYAIIDGDEYRGGMSNTGGVIFDGPRDHEAGAMHVSFGGLLYHEAYIYDRPLIEGFAWLGIDTLGDGNIDCVARGDFLAIQSGR